MFDENYATNPPENHLQFNDAPDEEEPESDIDRAATTVKVNRLNKLYDSWLRAESQSRDFAEAGLLKGIRKLCLKTILKSYPTPNANDLAQQITINVHRGLAEDADLALYKTKLSQWFNCDGVCSSRQNFSAWLNKIILNALRSSIRQDKQRAEDEYFDWLSPHKSGITRKAPTQQSEDDDPDDAAPSGTQKLLDKSYIEANEDGLIAAIDLERSIKKLPFRDQRLLSLTRFGYTSSEVAKKLNCDITAIYNRKVELRVLLGHEMEVDFSVVLHTCKPEFESCYELGAGMYITDAENKSYRQLPEKCKCRKRITRLESRRLLETGRAAHVFGLSPSGKTENDSKSVWADQAVQVPRVGLAGKTHIERAYASNYKQDKSDIEVAHEMDKAMRDKITQEYPADSPNWNLWFPPYTSYTDQESDSGVRNNLPSEPGRPCPDRDRNVWQPNPPKTKIVPREVPDREVLSSVGES